LGATELAARPLDVGAVGLGAARNLPRVTHAPAVMLEARPVLGILLDLDLIKTRSVLRIAVDQVQRELERLTRASGKLHEREKGHPLRVLAEDGLPVLGHLQPVGRRPAGDGRERLRLGVVGEGPELETYGG